MRSLLPDVIGGIAWWTNDDPNMAAYTPVYCCTKEIPKCYQRIQDEQDEITFSWNSAYWVENTVANIVYPFYSKMFPDLLNARNALEDEFEENQLEVEKRAYTLYQNNPESARDLLTKYSLGAADHMMEVWTKLFSFIVVKHNDMVQKPEENGIFKRSEYGLGEHVTRPGYPIEYWRKIVQESGDKYLLK